MVPQLIALVVFLQSHFDIIGVCVFCIQQIRSRHIEHRLILGTGVFGIGQNTVVLLKLQPQAVRFQAIAVAQHFLRAAAQNQGLLQPIGVQVIGHICVVINILIQGLTALILQRSLWLKLVIVCQSGSGTADCRSTFACGNADHILTGQFLPHGGAAAFRDSAPVFKQLTCQIKG